jgi:2Fe-2S ferredoxin
MPVVTVVPGDIRIEVATGETLAQAAWRQGYHWPTTCWGEMQCMVCAAVVVSGEDAAAPASSEEAAAISERVPRFRQQSGTRLACQLRVHGDGLVIEKQGVQPPSVVHTG